MTSIKVNDNQWAIGSEHIITRYGRSFKVWHEGNSFCFSSLKNATQFVKNLVNGMELL